MISPRIENGSIVFSDMNFIAKANDKMVNFKSLGKIFVGMTDVENPIITFELFSHKLMDFYILHDEKGVVSRRIWPGNSEIVDTDQRTYDPIKVQTMPYNELEKTYSYCYCSPLEFFVGVPKEHGVSLYPELIKKDQLTEDMDQTIRSSLRETQVLVGEDCDPYKKFITSPLNYDEDKSYKFYIKFAHVDTRIEKF
jgi:hypothetical protein